MFEIIFAFIVMVALIAFVSGILTGFYFSERQHEGDDHHRRWYDKKLEEQK